MAATRVGERGGERGAEARSRLLAAAEDAFLQHGFAAASTNRIASAAGASKATLFRHWPTKQALFAAVVERSARRTVVDIAAAVAGIEQPEAWLVALGTATLTGLMHPRALQLTRLLVLEGAHDAALQQAFASVGPPAMLAPMVGQLRQWQLSGVVTVDDPAAAAIQFFDLLCGGPVMRTLIGQTAPFDPVACQAQSRRAARLFLRGAAIAD